MGASPSATGLAGAEALEPDTRLHPSDGIPRAAFTPGPWNAERIDYDLHGLDASFEVNAGMRTVVQTHMREIKREGDWLRTDEANCRLIAAAPELYEALDRAVDFLKHAPLESGVCCCGDAMEDHGPNDGHSPTDELRYHAEGLLGRLEAALAKARGES